jgi:hypothetical protein
VSHPVRQGLVFLCRHQVGLLPHSSFRGHRAAARGVPAGGGTRPSVRARCLCIAVTG